MTDIKYSLYWISISFTFKEQKIILLGVCGQENSYVYPTGDPNSLFID
jgi:hypothetical protein